MLGRQRLIVRRTRLVGAQAELWPDWRHHAFLTNRTDPPDSILREVWTRSGGKPFARIEDVIATAELEGILDRYKKVAGFDRETLRSRPSFV